MGDGNGADRVVVVGGGIAGLVVARDVAAGGREVVVLEASDRLGGQLARVTLDGISVDAAAESFATRGGAVADYATLVGLGPEIVHPLESPAWLFRSDGAALQLPATSVLGIPGYPLAPDVIAAIGWRAALRASLDQLLIGQIGSRSTTLGQLVRTRMGRGVLDGLVAPVVRGVHSVSPDELPLERAHPGLRDALTRDGNLQTAVRMLRERAPAGSQVAGIRGGVVRLVDETLADLERFGAEVRTGARVRSVEPGVAVLASGERVAGELVVAAAGLVGDEPVRRRITVVAAVLDAPELDAHPRGTGMLVAPDAPVAARALTHSSAKWEWVAERAEGRQVLRLSYDSPPEDPARQVREDASTLFGMTLPAPAVVDATEWTRVQPRTHAVDGMHLVGEAGEHTGLAAIVPAARELAGRLLENDGTRRDPPLA